jgi:hypothetical protein
MNMLLLYNCRVKEQIPNTTRAQQYIKYQFVILRETAIFQNDLDTFHKTFLSKDRPIVNLLYVCKAKNDSLNYE